MPQATGEVQHLLRRNVAIGFQYILTTTNTPTSDNIDIVEPTK